MPKNRLTARLRLNEPLLVMRGDHFIVRDETAQRTLGGGIIIHPRVSRHRKNETELLSRLETLHRGNLARVVETFLDEDAAFALPIESIYQFINVREEEARAKIEGLDDSARPQCRRRHALYHRGEMAISSGNRY